MSNPNINWISERVGKYGWAKIHSRFDSTYQNGEFAGYVVVWHSTFLPSQLGHALGCSASHFESPSFTEAARLVDMLITDLESFDREETNPQPLV
jgi:hypothetical protein